MKRVNAQLRNFHRVFQHAAPDEPTLDEYPFKLRCKLILEEALEFIEACGHEVATNDYATWVVDEATVEVRKVKGREPDWPEMIDALCDLLYVTYGAAVSMGIDLEPFFEDVHRSNMAKALPDGTILKDANGKTVKPEAWRPPDIKGRLEWLLRKKTDG